MTACVPKCIGFEIELGNHFAGAAADHTALAAAKALVNAHHPHGEGPWDSTVESPGEFDRDGFRFYLDHEHAEICSPVLRSATDLVLAMRAARHRVVQCKKIAEASVGPLRVSFNNSNRQGAAWAFHLNVLVSRRAFDAWRDQGWRPLHAQWIPFLVTSLPLVGTGKVGSENGADPCAFQLSQRADFISQVEGLETVESKSVINTRDEPHADPARYARFHIIAWDTNLCCFANWLKAGLSQLLLALVEEEVPLPSLRLHNPIRSLHAVSRDLELSARLRLGNGGRETSLGIQWRLAEAAATHIAKGCAASAVPEANRLVEGWLQTLQDLETRHGRLCRRLDWCTKFDLLRRAQRQAPLDSQKALLLDLRYAEVGGLHEALEAAAALDPLPETRPRRAGSRMQPELAPRDTARAALVSRFGSHLARVSWDHAVGRGASGDLWVIPMDDPLAGHPIARIVTRARNWTACLRALTKRNLAQPIAIWIAGEERPREPFAAPLPRSLNSKTTNKPSDENHDTCTTR